MFQLENSEDELFLFALTLFKASGHAVTSETVYCNHTPEQTIYFDNKSDLALSTTQRSMLKNVACISHLFDVDAKTFEKVNGESVGFYSMKILSTKSSRSQTAYEIHCVMRQALSGSANVILFGYNEQVMLTLQGFDSEVFLSDWFQMDDDCDTLVERIHICSMSLKSARDYFNDFVYCCARWYYIYPVSGKAVEYDMLPIHYFSSLESNMDVVTVDREVLKEQIRESLRMAEMEYGNDYVEQGVSQVSTVDIGAELDLMALELDLDEDQEGLIDEEIDEEDDLNEEDEFEDGPDKPKEDYEFADLDDEIFRDPTLMVKWLQKNESD